MYEYFIGVKYKIGKNKYYFAVVDQTTVDNKKLYTFNIFKKTFLFWKIEKIIESPDFNECYNFCNNYLKNIFDNERQ